MKQRAASNYKAPVIVNDHAEYKKTTRGDKKKPRPHNCFS